MSLDHLAPPASPELADVGGDITPCCGRTISELGDGDRVIAEGEPTCGGIDGTPGWAYDDDGYCIRCGNGRWKNHMPECQLRDLFDRVNLAPNFTAADLGAPWPPEDHPAYDEIPAGTVITSIEPEPDPVLEAAREITSASPRHVTGAGVSIPALRWMVDDVRQACPDGTVSIHGTQAMIDRVRGQNADDWWDQFEVASDAAAQGDWITDTSAADDEPASIILNGDDELILASPGNVSGFFTTPPEQWAANARLAALAVHYLRSRGRSADVEIDAVFIARTDVPDNELIVAATHGSNIAVAKFVDATLAPRQEEGQAMKRHDLKCWSEFYADVAYGDKRFEVRFDDRGIAVGDVLVLHEFDAVFGESGEACAVVVTYRLSLSDAPGFPYTGVDLNGTDGEWVVLGIRFAKSIEVPSDPSPSPLEGTQA